VLTQRAAKHDLCDVCRGSKGNWMYASVCNVYTTVITTATTTHTTSALTHFVLVPYVHV
jgi:hypothetical protein